jgi:hypothetical protein
MAALAFLAALLLHARLPRDAGPWVLAPMVAFGIGLLTKETVVAFPLLALLYDLWVGEGRAGVRRRVPAYAGYAVTLAAYWALRTKAVGAGVEWVFPYTLPPTDPRFAAHLVAQGKSYLANLFMGETTRPFLQPAELAPWSSATGFLVGALACVAIAAVLRRDRRAYFFLVVAALSWLPSSVAYVSERYLYLPSAALAALVALVVATLRPRRALLAPVLAIVTLWAGHQAKSLSDRNRYFSDFPSVPAEIEALFEPIRDRIPAGAEVLWLDFPMDWLSAQFMQETLRVQLDDPELGLRILTHAPEGPAEGGRLILEQRDANTLRTSRPEGLVFRQGSLFRWIECAPGVTVERPGLPFTVTVLAVTDRRCETVDFTFARPLDEMVVVWFERTAPLQVRPGGGRSYAGVMRVLGVPGG